MTAPERRRSAITKFTARLRKADRKRQILLHAKNLFVSLGYQQTTTEKIAQAAGVTEPVLYRHFESKKALFLEVLQEIRQATHKRWLAETTDVPDPQAKLMAIFDMYLGSAREHALEFRIMHRTLIEVDDGDIAACLRSFYLDGERLLAAIITEGQARGNFRADLDPRVGAWEMIRTGMGYTLTQGLGIPLYQEPGYLPKAIECMLHCLKNPEPAPIPRAKEPETKVKEKELVLTPVS